jgi:hypothetical protein
VDGKVALEVGTMADRRIIYSETGFKELLAERVSSWHDILGATMCGREPRVQWLVDQKMLVTLPASNDRVIFRPWDVPALVKKSGEDYLWLASLPPHVAYKGDKLRYQISVVSRSKGLKYRLAEKPQGMSISPKGQVAWDVPDNFAEEIAPVIVTITDAEGNELIHSFELKIAPKVKVVKNETLPKEI